MDTLIEQNKELNKEVSSDMITSVWQRQKLSKLIARLTPSSLISGCDFRLVLDGTC